MGHLVARLNAALQGFAEAESDGIVQVSTGGAEFLSGSRVKDMVVGATALAEYAHHVAGAYPVHIALHTDHCPKDKLDRFVRPLVLKIDGDVGNKKLYDPRSYGRAAEDSMARRGTQACEDLRSSGTRLT